MNTTAPTHNPLDLLRTLSADEIEARLSEIRAEDRALRTLLRSLRARDRALEASRRQRQEASHAE